MRLARAEGTRCRGAPCSAHLNKLRAVSRLSLLMFSLNISVRASITATRISLPGFRLSFSSRNSAHTQLWACATAPPAHGHSSQESMLTDGTAAMHHQMPSQMTVSTISISKPETSTQPHTSEQKGICSHQRCHAQQIGDSCQLTHAQQGQCGHTARASRLGGHSRQGWHLHCGAPAYPGGHASAGG